MKTLKGWMVSISKLSTGEALAVLIPFALIAMVLWNYPVARPIVVAIMVVLVLGLVFLVGLAVWLKGMAARDHS